MFWDVVSALFFVSFGIPIIILLIMGIGQIIRSKKFWHLAVPLIIILSGLVTIYFDNLIGYSLLGVGSIYSYILYRIINKESETIEVKTDKENNNN